MSQINQTNQTDSSSNRQGSLSSMLMLRFSGNPAAGGVAKTERQDGTATRTTGTGTHDGFDAVLKERMTAKENSGPTTSLSTVERKDRPLQSAERETGSRVAQRRVDAAHADRQANAAARNEDGEKTDGLDSNEDFAVEKPKMSENKTTVEAKDETAGTTGTTGETTQETKESPWVALNRILQTMLALAAEMTKTADLTAETTQTVPEGTAQGDGTETPPVTGATVEAGTNAETSQALLDLLSQATGKKGADLSGELGGLLESAGGEPSEFLKKLADLLEQAGISADNLKSLSVKLHSIAGGDVMLLKLNAMADDLKLKLHAMIPTEDTAPAAAETTDPTGEIPVMDGLAETAQGQTSAEEGNSSGTNTPAGGKGDEAVVRTTEGTTDSQAGTAAAATAPAAATAANATAAGQQTGFQNAMAAHRNQHQEPVAGTGQTGRTVVPNPLTDPETGLSVTGQVTAKVSELTGNARHEMELQLKPESLGKINLKLVEEKGQILAKFTAESEQVRAILESNMQLLKDSLEKSGLTVQQLSVSVGQQPGRGRQEDGRDGDSDNGRGNAYANRGIRVSANFGTQGANLSVRMKDYLNGPDSTISLKA